MSKKKEEREVTVKLPQVPVAKKPEIVTDTVEEERIKVFKAAERIGESISGLMITAGILTLFFSLQYLLYPSLTVPGIPAVKAILTPKIIVIIMGILGVINMLCGFVMLAKK